jgi:hypothetical protein
VRVPFRRSSKKRANALKGDVFSLAGGFMREVIRTQGQNDG